MAHFLEYVPMAGATSLGIVVGWLVRFFIRRFEKWNASMLRSVITIALGGAAARFVGHSNNVFWFYPIGLLIGFVAYQIVVMISLAKDAENLARGLPVIRNFPKDDPRYLQ